MSESDARSANETWYDEEIAPALLALAKRCEERGMSFIAEVEHDPGDRGATYSLTKDASLSMWMIYLCGKTAPNVDSYMINLRRHCDRRDIDIGASFTMRLLSAKEPT